MHSLRRTIIKLVPATIIAALIAGCASYSPPVDSSQKPNASRGYIFGRFAKTGAPNFGLVIENESRTKQYTIQFANKSDGLRADIPGQETIAIEVEPGTYEITHFIAASAMNEVIGRGGLSGWPYNLKFQVHAGKSSYIGDYTGIYDWKFAGAGTRLHWQIEQMVNRFEATKQAFHSIYPAIASQTATENVFPSK